MRTQRAAPVGTSERASGNALVVVLIIVFVLLAGATTSLSLAHAVADRIAAALKLDRTAAIGESGLAWVSEAWRRDPAFLAINDLDGDGEATTALENPAIGVPHPLAGGGFTITAIGDAPVGGTVHGRVVTLRASLDGVHVRWRAIISPNLLSPIQGVGTVSRQDWSGGARFGSLSSTPGTVFSNTDVDVRGQSTIEGDVTVHGDATTSSGGAITGTITEGAPEVAFPDQQAIIDAVVAQASGAKPAGFWSDARAAIVVDQPVTAMESLSANAGALGSGFNGTNMPGMRHLVVRGGVTHLPAGSYSFGRLWLDGSTMTIRAPAGGGTLVLADLYLTGGARLVIDARDGPFQVISPRNNVFFEGADVGSSDARRWNGSAWVAGAPSVRLDGGAAQYTWNRTAGQGGNTGPKPARGTTAGYDDWTVKDDSALVIATPSPGAKGFEVFMPEGVDLVLANGGRILGGIQPAQYDAAASPATTIAGLDALDASAKGFIAWSGGGYLPRLNIDASGANPGHASRVVGLTYGGFEATIGAQGKFAGAFVGKSMNCKGEVLYDPRLSALVVEPEPNTHHVVARWRVTQ